MREKDKKRLSFVKIYNSEKYHPNHKKYKFTKKKLLINKQKISNIIKNLSKYIKLYFNSFKNFGGEWEYLNKNRRYNYIKCLKENNLVSLNKNFSNFFRNDTSYGICTPSFSDFKNFTKSQILFDIDIAKEFVGLQNLSSLSINKTVGNPYGLIYKKKIIIPDVLRHYYFAQKIINLIGIKENNKNLIIEIGGGYGGMAKILKLSKLNHIFIGIDLIETLLIQYYFLKKQGIKVKIINRVKDIKKDYINLVPYDYSEDFLKKIYNCSLLFNSRSFSEMSLKVLKKYFNLINNYLKPSYIYHENSNYLLFPKSKRHIEIVGNKFPINKNNYKLINLSISPFLSGGGRYREFLYKKTITPINE
jgi:hypothetical protein